MADSTASELRAGTVRRIRGTRASRMAGATSGDPQLMAAGAPARRSCPLASSQTSPLLLNAGASYSEPRRPTVRISFSSMGQGCKSPQLHRVLAGQAACSSFCGSTWEQELQAFGSAARAQVRWQVLARTTSSGMNCTCWCWCRALATSSRRSSAATLPSRCRGWRTEVSGTAAAPANSMSSYPTMARSSGTRMPRAAGQQIRQLAVYPVQQAGAQQILDVAVAGGKHGFRSDRADKADKGE